MRLFLFLTLFALLLGCAQPEEAPQQELPPPAGEQVEEAPEETPEPAEPVTEPEEPVAEELLESEEITYNSFGWDIHGTLYPAVDKKNPTVGIILVPVLGETRDSYPLDFIESLHEKLPHAIVLAIDPRGHGESTNLGTWEDFGTDSWKAMAGDIVEAKKYFKTNYPTADEYYVVGASIGSTAAIHAGKQENDIVKIAMLSPGMEYKGVEIDRAVENYVHPLFLAATSGDSYSANSASEIADISSSQVTLKIYEGSEHGTDMIGATNVENDLISFFK